MQIITIVRIEGNIENETCSTTWEDPKTVVKAYFDHRTNPLGPQKDKSDPKIKSNFNVTIHGIIENENCSTTCVDPKTVFDPYPDSKKSQLGPQKVKKTLKLSQIQKFELKNT